MWTVIAFISTNILSFWIGSLIGYKAHRDQKEINEDLDDKLQQSNECHDCAKFDEMPKGPRCKTCDNGSCFQKKEEA